MNKDAEQVVTHQPAINFSISFLSPHNRTGGRTSNGKILENTMTIAPMIRKHSIFDYYGECGPSANLILLSCILFLWIVFICCLQRADKDRSRYVNLLLPSSLLPILIGIFGSSHALYQGLHFKYNQSQATDIVRPPEELVIPLIAGSFLSGIFIFNTIIL